jgi:hypothetical protein
MTAPIGRSGDVLVGGLLSPFHLPISGQNKRFQTLLKNHCPLKIRFGYISWGIQTLANERSAAPYPEFGPGMRKIREQKYLSIKELFTPFGIPENALEAAESGELEIPEEDSKNVQRVYWSLSSLEASPAEYGRYHSPLLGSKTASNASGILYFPSTTNRVLFNNSAANPIAV